MNIELPPDYQALSELEIMAQATNYNAWIWKTIGPSIRGNVLEIGAGIGTFTRYIQRYHNVFATDVAQNCLDILRNKFEKCGNIIVRYFDISDAMENEYWVRQNIGTVICLNVLEHIEDDVSALRALHSILPRNARLILMVPAFQFVFGTIDKLDGHHRRYSKSELTNKLSLCGYRLKEARYFNSIGLFAWLYTNRVVKNKSTSIAKVKFYDRLVVRFLRTIESVWSPPFGQSLIIVSEKL
jgi:SAM-dependent methyltransferase